MKKVPMTAILAVSLSGAGGMAHGKEETMETTIRRFAEAGDRRDTKALESVLDPSFRVVFAMNDEPKATVLSRADYLAMMKAGKLGGAPRTVDVERTEVAGAFGFARVRMKREGATFDGMITLVRSDGAWRIIEDATVMRVEK